MAATGVLNLAASSTISGSVVVYGGMNLFDPPPGSTATVCTIAQGRLRVYGTAVHSAVLNLNNLTLNLPDEGVAFDKSFVTTNLNFDTGVMGNIVAKNILFTNTNSLTQSATGTPRTILRPLIEATDGASGLIGDFTTYVLSPGVTQNIGFGFITLSYSEELPPEEGEPAPPPPPPPPL